MLTLDALDRMADRRPTRLVVIDPPAREPRLRVVRLALAFVPFGVLAALALLG